MDTDATIGQARAPVELGIDGMTCGGCVNAVRRVLSGVPGVSSARVDLGSANATIEGTARPEALIAAVRAAGYGARLVHRGSAGSALDGHE